MMTTLRGETDFLHRPTTFADLFRNDHDWSAFLGRAVGEADLDSFRPVITGKRILVTGAGGYIGSALVKVLARLDPVELVALDSAELGLHQLELDLTASGSSVPTRFVVGSVNDQRVVREIFEQNPTHIVYHAAACKHVPLMERNPFSAASTNALATMVLAEAATAAGVEQCVLLSTDKAADPRSIMGATKRIAELIFLASMGGMQTKILRLGNVLGSSGSVVPLFLDQISRGGPVTLTHVAATRLFLTVQETVVFLLAALSCGSGSSLLIPALEEPHRIYDLATYLIGNAKGSRHIEIAVTGLRAGEKLTERLTSSTESISAAVTRGGLREVQTQRIPWPELLLLLKDLRRSVDQRDVDLLLETIRKAVPDYHASEVVEAQLGRVMEVRSE